MNKIIWLLLLILSGAIFPCKGLIAQFSSETIFGLDVPINRWGISTDADNRNSPFNNKLGIPRDGANLRIVSKNDTTDIILLLDEYSGLLWMRTPAQNNLRPLQHLGSYEFQSINNGKALTPYSLAVASPEPFYDPTRDYLFINDREGNRLIRLKFKFNPDFAEADSIIEDSSIFIDDNFYCSRLSYINIDPKHRQNNRLLALDDINNRIVVFSDAGQLINMITFDNPLSQVDDVYNLFTYKIESDTSIILYILYNSDGVAAYRLVNFETPLYLGQIHLRDRIGSIVSDIVYSPETGLCAIGLENSSVFRVAEDLTRVIERVAPLEINFNTISEPLRLIILPQRLMFIEASLYIGGITTFSFSKSTESKIFPPILTLIEDYPKILNFETAIEAELFYAGKVNLSIYNDNGEKVRDIFNRKLSPGKVVAIWDGRDDAGELLDPGPYIIKLSTSDMTITKRLMFMGELLDEFPNFTPEPDSGVDDSE
jgi:hypothetical protein